MSLENPQLEDGFTPVANTIMEPICHTRLSGTDWAFLHFLWRKTYGWSKLSDIISLSQFCEGTGMTQAHVCRTIKRLLAMNVIFRHVASLGNPAIARIGNTGTATYEFNKRVWTWKTLPELAIHKKSIASLGNQPLPELAHTTDTLTTEKGSLKSSPLPKSLDQTNYQGFQDAWTSICVSAGLHGVRDWSTWHERIKGAWNRVASSKDQSWSALSPLERICDLFTHAAKIPFLSGDNSRKWKADLEFVLRPLSIDRIMGGYYCDMVQSEPLKPIPVRTAEEDRLQRERGLAWLDPDKVKEEVKDER